MLFRSEQLASEALSHYRYTDFHRDAFPEASSFLPDPDQFVLAGKEKLALIRAKGDALVLETLFVAEDVKAQDEIDEAVAATTVRDEELALAEQLVSGLEGPFEPEELRSEYRASLRELLEAKAAGVELPPAPEPVAEAPTIDLMDALRAAIESAHKQKPAQGKAKASAKKQAAGTGGRKRSAG